MEWYAYAIIIMGIIIFFETILFFLTRYQIKLRLKSFLVRKAPYLFVVEIRNDGKIEEGLRKVTDDQLKFNNKTYPIDKRHIKILPQYGITGVCVSEAIGTSIDPTNTNKALSPTVINGIIKRVKATAIGDTYVKMIKIMVMVVGIQCLVVIALGFVIYKLLVSAEKVGINISF